MPAQLRKRYFISDAAVAHLNAIRGISALAVMLGHVRTLFFIDYSEVSHKNTFLRAFYFLTGFGYQAVIIFFVLSGLLVTLSILRMHERGEWTWGQYLTQRISRLWIVLIPALVIGFFWDQLGLFFFSANSIYSGNATVIEGNVANRLDFMTAFGNGLFLQKILFPTFGSNGPLWSLSYEFWYYILFPLSLGVFVGGSLLRKAVSFALALFVALTLPFYITLNFGIWLLGALLTIYCRENIRMSLGFKIISVFFFVGSFAMSRIVASLNPEFNNFQSFVSDFILGIATSLFILTCLKETAMNRFAIFPYYEKTSKWLADFSYTIYLTHLPFLVFLSAWIVGNKRWEPSAVNLMLGTLIAVLVLSYSFVLSLVTERKTEKVRSYLSTFFSEPVLN